MRYGMVMWRKCKTGVKGPLASQRPPMASHRLRGGARSLPRPPLQPFALPPPQPHAPLSPSLKPQRTPLEAEADHPPGHFLFSYSLYFLACITTWNYNIHVCICFLSSPLEFNSMRARTCLKSFSHPLRQRLLYLRAQERLVEGNS